MKQFFYQMTISNGQTKIFETKDFKKLGNEAFELVQQGYLITIEKIYK